MVDSFRPGRWCYIGCDVLFALFTGIAIDSFDLRCSVSLCVSDMYLYSRSFKNLEIKSSNTIIELPVLSPCFSTLYNRNSSVVV